MLGAALLVAGAVTVLYDGSPADVGWFALCESVLGGAAVAAASRQVRRASTAVATRTTTRTSSYATTTISGRLTPRSGTANWRTYAHWAIEQVLRRPESVTYRGVNDTYAYTAPVRLRNSQGMVVKTHHRLVVIADRSKRIITAHPR